MTQPTPSPLLGLPPELRNGIYTFIFAGHEVHIGDQRYTLIRKGDCESIAPAILLACRQILHEAYGIYYSTARFVIFSSSVMHHWLESLPNAAQLALSNVAYDCYRFRGMLFGPTALGAVAQYAEEVLQRVVYKQLRHPNLEHLRGRVEASILLANGQCAWTTTPMVTYEHSVKDFIENGASGRL